MDTLWPSQKMERFTPGAMVSRKPVSVTFYLHTLSSVGDYGKLGHGTSNTQKVPKLISSLSDKVITHISAGYRYDDVNYLVDKLSVSIIGFIVDTLRQSRKMELSTHGEKVISEDLVMVIANPVSYLHK